MCKGCKKLRTNPVSMVNTAATSSYGQICQPGTVGMNIVNYTKKKKGFYKRAPTCLAPALLPSNYYGFILYGLKLKVKNCGSVYNM